MRERESGCWQCRKLSLRAKACVQVTRREGGREREGERERVRERLH